MSTVQTIADALRIERRFGATPGLWMADEQRDIHDIDDILANDERLARVLETVRGGASGQFRPRIIKLKTKHFGPVWDYRAFTQPNGGKIPVALGVDHIPVIRQMAGRADLDVLWRVLVSQGLMVQRGTDAEGQVAFYTPGDRMCFHARGANSFSLGIEHMHATTVESWTDKQLNAAAFVRAHAHEQHGLPLGWAALSSGAGVVGVRQRGWTGHENVSRRAGFNDRSDPGDLFPEREVRERAAFYLKHHRF